MQSFEFPRLTHTLQITGCHFDIKPPGWRYPRHHHALFELLHCMEGEVIQEVNRETLILSPGDWLLIRSGVRHQSFNEGDLPYGYFNIHFDLDDTEVRSILASSPYRHISAAEADQIGLQERIACLESIIGRNEPLAEGETVQKLRFEDKLLFQSCALLIIHRILGLLREAPSLPTSAPVQERALSAVDVAHAIEERLSISLSADEQATVTGVAKELNLSRSQCTRLFSKVYGMSPRQYMSRQKLNMAKELLTNTNLPMTLIAERLGFRSASHFSRQFRRWTGQSPTEYKPRL